MIFTKLNYRRRIFIVILTTVLLSAFSGLPKAIAQSFPDPEVSLKFPQGSDRGAPRRTRGVGSRRTPCSVQESDSQVISLTALTPPNNIVKTLAPNPSIYLYVPAVKDKQALFRVIDKQAEEIVYQTTVSLNTPAGILKLNLPDTVQLQPDTLYEWGFFIQCDRNDPTADEGIEGWIERAEITEMEAQPAEQTPLAQAQRYIDAGIWNEAIALLEQLRDSNPTAWAELLESVGLDPAIASSPTISVNSNP